MKKSAAVVSPSPTPRHLRFDRRNAVIGGIVLVIFLGIAIVWLVMRNHTQVPAATQKPKQTIDQALNTQTGATKAQLEAALQANPTTPEKQQLLQLLANKMQQEGNWSEAVKYLEEAYSSGVQDVNLTENIAMTYAEKLNNKPQALKYFKISLSLVKQGPGDQKNPSKIETFLTGKIKGLEDQGVKAAS